LTSHSGACAVVVAMAVKRAVENHIVWGEEKSDIRSVFARLGIGGAMGAFTSALESWPAASRDGEGCLSTATIESDMARMGVLRGGGLETTVPGEVTTTKSSLTLLFVWPLVSFVPFDSSLILLLEDAMDTASSSFFFIRNMDLEEEIETASVSLSVDESSFLPITHHRPQRLAATVNGEVFFLEISPLKMTSD
jgi:hypothetical protein